MTEADKRIFEAKLDDYIDTVQEMITKGEDMRYASSSQQLQISPLQYGEELDKHNEQMSQYIKQQFGYNYTTTVIEVKIPALNSEMLEDDTTFKSILTDITGELRKFGTLR